MTFGPIYILFFCKGQNLLKISLLSFDFNFQKKLNVINGIINVTVDSCIGQYSETKEHKDTLYMIKLFINKGHACLIFQYLKKKKKKKRKYETIYKVIQQV